MMSHVEIHEHFDYKTCDDACTCGSEKVLATELRPGDRVAVPGLSAHFVTETITTGDGRSIVTLVSSGVKSYIPGETVWRELRTSDEYRVSAFGLDHRYHR
jgi:hypothetical protein